MGDDDKSEEEEVNTEPNYILAKLHKDALKRKKQKSDSFGVNSNKKAKKRKLIDQLEDSSKLKTSQNIDSDERARSENNDVKLGKKKTKRRKQSFDGKECPDETNSSDVVKEHGDDLSLSSAITDNDGVLEMEGGGLVKENEESEQEEPENTELGTSQIRKEVGGFTVIGDVRKKKTDKVKGFACRKKMDKPFFILSLYRTCTIIWS